MNAFNFIFEKENSINDTLIDDVIDLYKEEREKDNFCDFIIMYDDNFTKFKAYLLNEITEKLFSYIIWVAEQTNDAELKQYFRETFECVNGNVSEFKITTNIFKNKEVDVINEKRLIQCYDKKYSNKITMLKFIWFMNDYDGEIFIQNHKIIPKKGKLIIFPTSWCFPYQEINNVSSEIITISGFFYKNIYLKKG